MRTAFLTFFAIALLGLHQSAHARRGGGGSSGGSSGGSGRSSGSRNGRDRSRGRCYRTTSSVGNASDPFDPMYTDQWLYKFVGSYYNGSVEVEAMIDVADVSCDEQRPVFKQKLDAVLMIGERPPDFKKPNSSPYMFSIVGWEEGTQPGGTPSTKTDWVSPDTRLIYQSISRARAPSNKFLTTKQASWIVTNQKSDDSYSFDAVFEEQFYNWQESRTFFSVSPCNGSQPVDLSIDAYNRPASRYKTSTEFAQNRTRANGTFDGTSATLSIGGEFRGTFTNWYTEQPGIGPSNKLMHGTYKLKFSGNLDRPHSHALSTSGQTPSWTENWDLLPGGSEAVSAAGASTTCVGGSSSAGSRAEVGKAILGLAALGGLVVVGMGIVLW